jgi:hypothetical protein
VKGCPGMAQPPLVPGQVPLPRSPPRLPPPAPPAGPHAYPHCTVSRAEAPALARHFLACFPARTQACLHPRACPLASAHAAARWRGGRGLRCVGCGGRAGGGALPQPRRPPAGPRHLRRPGPPPTRPHPLSRPAPAARPGPTRARVRESCLELGRLAACLPPAVAPVSPCGAGRTAPARTQATSSATAGAREPARSMPSSRPPRARTASWPAATPPSAPTSSPSSTPPPPLSLLLLLLLLPLLPPRRPLGTAGAGGRGGGAWREARARTLQAHPSQRRRQA